MNLQNSQVATTMKIKRAILLVIAGSVVLFCAWFLFLARSEVDNPPFETAEYYQPAPTPGSDLDWIEADSEIKIPSSAREIHAMISGFRELDVWVRFDLPEKDLSSFLNNTLCGLPPTEVTPHDYTDDELDPDWWQPPISKDLAECRGGNSTTRQHILIDGTNSRTLVIYVFSWTDNFATPETHSE